MLFSIIRNLYTCTYTHTHSCIYAWTHMHKQLCFWFCLCFIRGHLKCNLVSLIQKLKRFTWWFLFIIFCCCSCFPSFWIQKSGNFQWLPKHYLTFYLLKMYFTLFYPWKIFSFFSSDVVSSFSSSLPSFSFMSYSNILFNYTALFGQLYLHPKYLSKSVNTEEIAP